MLGMVDSVLLLTASGQNNVTPMSTRLVECLLFNYNRLSHASHLRLLACWEMKSQLSVRNQIIINCINGIGVAQTCCRPTTAAFLCRS